ncbi:MAG: RecQ family ATP-dependent DNA helicase [Gemmatimonadales bacterium]|nr:RecQ family ATP-dependent DNA helicase [Gemmatimonadales bacterium]
MTSLEVARHVLQVTFGHPDFRPLQARVVAPLMAGRDVLAVLPTGGGKSVCFQVPALATRGLTLVVSPLIALMQDQVGALYARGVEAVAFNSTVSRESQDAALMAASAGTLRLLYTSPERLTRLADELVARRIPVTRLAVDEAHCIVEWGHDFRPSYRALRAAREAVGGPQCIALTGSATPEVRNEIASALALRPNTATIVGSFDRPNLRFDVVPVSGRDDRLAKLVVLVRASRDPAIVYAPTRGLVDGLTRVLREAGVDASPYHAGMTPDERRSTLERFLGDDLRVVVATCAFGMGIDKPDVRLVVHWSSPGTPESYYQEAGRAGRDGGASRCVLLHHPADDVTPRQQLDVTFPPERLVERAWADPSLRARQPAGVVASIDRLSAELRPDRGRVNWQGVRRRKREAERRLTAMMRYATARECRRRMLIGWFGETLRRCSGCDRCSSRS